MEIPDSASIILGFARACGFAAFVPVPEQAIGSAARIAGAVLLTAVLATEGEVAAAALTPTLGGIAAQFLIGIAASLPLALLLAAVSMWGELFEAGRGQSIGSMYDPLSGVQQAVLPVALSQGVFLLLLGEGAFSSAVGALLAPPLTGAEPAAIGGVLIILALAALTQTFAAVLPITALFLLIDAACGVVGRGAQGIALSSEPFLIKSVAGWLALLAVVRSGWLPHPFDLAAF